MSKACLSFNVTDEFNLNDMEYVIINAKDEEIYKNLHTQQKNTILKSAGKTTGKMVVCDDVTPIFMLYKRLTKLE